MTMSSSGIYEYRIVEKMATGSFGVVFKVERKKDLKLFVMKRIPLENLDPSERQDAVKEFYVMKELCHPFIAHQYDAFLFNDNDLCLIMEFYDGGDMDRAISARRDEDDAYFPFRRVMLWFSEMLLAVHYLHTKGIIHRDLKTHNIFFDEDRDHLAVGDFGIAEKIEPNAVQNWMMSMEHSSDNVNVTSLRGEGGGAELVSSLTGNGGGNGGSRSSPLPSALLPPFKGDIVTMVPSSETGTPKLEEPDHGQGDREGEGETGAGHVGHGSNPPTPALYPSRQFVGSPTAPQSPSSMSGSAGLSHPAHGYKSPPLRSSPQTHESPIPALMKGTPLYMSPEMLQGAAGSTSGVSGGLSCGGGGGGASAPTVNASTPSAPSPLFRRNNNSNSNSNSNNNNNNNSNNTPSCGTHPIVHANNGSNALMGQKSDVWSLGCILYELLSLRHPFYSKDMALLVLRVTRGERAPLPSHYPQEVRDLVDRLLSLQPEQRPSCKEVLRMPLVSAFTMEMLEERGGVLRPGATNSAEVIDMEPARNGGQSDDDDDDDDDEDDEEEETDAGEAAYAALLKEVEEEESSVIRRAGTAYRNRHRGTRALLKQLRRLKLESNPSLVESTVQLVEESLAKSAMPRPSQYLAEAEHFNESVNARLRAANLQLGSISGSFFPLSENNTAMPGVGGVACSPPPIVDTSLSGAEHFTTVGMGVTPSPATDTDTGVGEGRGRGRAGRQEEEEEEEEGGMGWGRQSGRQSHSSLLPPFSSMERRGRQGTAAGHGAAHHPFTAGSGAAHPLSHHPSFSALEQGIVGAGAGGGRRSGSGSGSEWGNRQHPSPSVDRLRPLAGQSLNSAMVVPTPSPSMAEPGGLSAPSTAYGGGPASSHASPLPPSSASAGGRPREAAACVVDLLYRHLQDPSTTPCPAFWADPPLDNVVDVADAPLEVLAREVDTMRGLLAALYRQRALQRGTLELLQRYQPPQREGEGPPADGGGGVRGVLPFTTGKTGAGPLSYSVLLPSTSSHVSATGLSTRDELLAAQRGLIEETDEVSRSLANEVEDLVRPAQPPDVHRVPIAPRYRSRTRQSEGIPGKDHDDDEDDDEDDEDDGNSGGADADLNWDQVELRLPTALLPYVRKRRELYDLLFPLTEKERRRQQQRRRRRKGKKDKTRHTAGEKEEEEEDQEEEEEDQEEEHANARSSTFLTSTNTSPSTSASGAIAQVPAPPFTREEFENVYVYYADHDLLRRDPQRVRRMVPQKRTWQYLPLVDTIVRLDRFLRKAQGMS